MSFGLLSAASRCFLTSASVMTASASIHLHLLHPFRNLHSPAEFPAHGFAQLRGGAGFAMNKIRDAWFLRKSVQPLQEFPRIGVIAELLKSGDLRTYRDEVTKNLDL